MSAKLLFFLVFLTACALPQSLRKTTWTVEEVKDWYAQKYSTWEGILYQGSDTVHHHFISRVGDEWAFLNIYRNELKMADERVYVNSSSGPLGYYFVDPEKDFAKIKDY